MQRLFLFQDEGKPFDPEEIKAILQQIPGFIRIRPKPDSPALFDCDYHHAGEGTYLEFKSNAECMVIAGFGRASVSLALEIQKRYPKPIRVTDMDFSFNFSLTEIDSAEEMWRRTAGDRSPENR